MLVWVASFPRSGNTLTLRTLQGVYGVNRFCAIHKQTLFMKGWNEGYEVPKELVGLSQDELLEALRERPETYFVKSHRLRDSADPAPALYVVRDGRDVHVSLAHWIEGKKVGPHERPFPVRLRSLVRSRGPVSRGNWSDHVHAWRTRSAPTAIIRFEELVEDPPATVKRACDELGVSLPEPTGELASFSELQERNPKMYRKGQAGGWREEMPERTQERFWHHHGAEMEALGYSFDGNTAGAAKRS